MTSTFIKPKFEVSGKLENPGGSEPRSVDPEPVGFSGSRVRV